MKLLLIKNLEILNANAISSPYTIGFPAMTAWLGAMHALQRHLNAAGFQELKFKSIGVACHELDLQTVEQGFNHSIISSRNPLNKDGSLPSTIPEARCHLDVSLVIEYEGKGIESDLERKAFTEKTYELIMSKMKIAGGTVHSLDQKTPLQIQNVEPEDEKKFLARLMPSWVIVERRNLVKNAMKDGKDALDAILEHLKVTSGQPRKKKGWIVPIATGFYGISKPAFAKNQRDPSVEHRFAESIVTLGEFKMPYQIKSLDDMLWRYQQTSANDLYICTTEKEDKHV